MANRPDLTDEKLLNATRELHGQGRKLTRTALREYVAEAHGAGVTSARAGEAIRTVKAEVAAAERGTRWVPDDDRTDGLPEGILPVVRRLPVTIHEAFSSERRRWAERQDEMHRALQEAHTRQLERRDAKLASAEEGLARAREQLSEIGEDRDALRAQLEERDTRIEDLKVQADQDRTEAAARLAEERDRRDASQANAQRATEALHEAKEALAGAVAERQGAAREIQALREQVADLREQVREFRAEAKAARDRSDALRDELADCQRTKARLEAASDVRGGRKKRAKKPKNGTE
jgi:hypothetical protein